MRSVLVVSIDDLRLLTILCAHCHTQVTLDLDMEYPPGSGHEPFKSPTACPRCGSKYDSSIPAAVNGMQKVYKALAQHGNAVSFTPPAPAPAK